MKILLIYPYFLESRVQTVEDVRVMPLGLYYVAAVLKQHGYNVQILNWHRINETPEKIAKLLRAEKPDVIGFSIVHANRWGAVEIARVARQVDPRVTIVLGGIGATFLWEHFLTHFSEIDFVVLGEGEYPFLNLVRHLETGGSPATLAGIAYRQDGIPVKSAMPAAVADLDELADPAASFDYRHIALTRGCTGNCSFCGSPRFWGRRVRSHSADYFVHQLELMVGRGIDSFYVCDDTFTLNRKRVISICRKIVHRKMNISWTAISRVDSIDDQLLYWMRKAGCIQISYGVESGSEKIRRFLNKKISTHQIVTAFELTQKYGILARAYFIYGCPGESRETIAASLELIQRIKPLGVIFYILDIFPGTALYEDFKRKMKLTDDIWINRLEDIMYFESDPNLTREMILEFGQTLRTGFYRDLPGFVDALQLIDDPSLVRQHSDFYSRLAMTFDHGDYSRVDAIEHKQRLAEKLYHRALDYYPNARAYLGLGILNQKGGDHRQAVDIVSRGLAHFPGDVQLNICLGVSLMNLQRYEQALASFEKCAHVKEALSFAARCCSALGDENRAAVFAEKFEAL
jgi:radical SAM superfamily enzyme YgiQ (UPF0313 family)